MPTVTITDCRQEIISHCRFSQAQSLLNLGLAKITQIYPLILQLETIEKKPPPPECIAVIKPVQPGLDQGGAQKPLILT
jgi:hypothetical protein